MSKLRRLQRNLRPTKSVTIAIRRDGTLALMAWAAGSPPELMLPGLREKIDFLTSDLDGLKFFAGLHGFDVSTATTIEEVRQAIVQADDDVWHQLRADIQKGAEHGNYRV